MSNSSLNTKRILITGGSGLIGRHLTAALLERGYMVSHLSRKPGSDPDVKTFLWEIGKNKIDEHCIDEVDVVVHLAGAGIADKKWTPQRKKEIVDSRTKSIELIYGLIKSRHNKVSAVISASGVGYYSDRGDELLTETSLPNNDFMAECCIAWKRPLTKVRL